MKKEKVLFVCTFETETRNPPMDKDEEGNFSDPIPPFLWDAKHVPTKEIYDAYLKDFRPDVLEDYNVLYTGVGKINATMKLTQRLHSSHLHYLPEMPELVINFGTAGSKNIPPGTLVDCTKFVERDMDVTEVGFKFGQTPWEDTATDMIIEFEDVFNPIGNHYTCGSGDNIGTDIFFKEPIKQMGHNKINVDVFDMEAYALAKVCHYYDVPFISFKYILSDIKTYVGMINSIDKKDPKKLQEYPLYHWPLHPENCDGDDQLKREILSKLE